MSLAKSVSRSSTHSAGNNNNMTPYFASSAHERALQSVQEGLSNNNGDVLLTGAVGSGKTLLLHRLMLEPQARVRYLYCAASGLDFDQVLGFICDHLGLPLSGPSRSDRLRILGIYLRTTDRTLALLIDDADKLQENVIGHLLMLQRSVRQRRSLRLVLCGHDGLLSRYSRQRKRHPLPTKAVCVHLGAIDSTELPAYLQVRFGSHFDPAIIERSVCARIEYHTAGSPDKLNRLIQAIQKTCPNLAQLSAPIIDDIAMREWAVSSAETTPAALAKHSDASAEAVAAQFESFKPEHAERELATGFWRAGAAALGLAAIFCAVLVFALLANTDQSAGVRLANEAGFEPPARTVSAPTPVGVDRQISSQPLAPSIASAPSVAGSNQVLATGAERAQDIAEGSALAVDNDRNALPLASPSFDLKNTSSDSDSQATLAELRFWQRIKNSDNAEQYQSYLRAYPAGLFGAIAEKRVTEYARPPQSAVDTTEIATLLQKADRAFSARALTLPQQDNALKWIEAVLDIEPENAAAKTLRAQIIDTYIEWSMRNFQNGRKNSASAYLQRARGLSEYASKQQLAAIGALDTELRRKSSRKIAKRKVVRKRTVSRSKRRQTPSVATWLRQVDARMQRVGRNIDRRIGTYNARAGRKSSVRQSFSAR